MYLVSFPDPPLGVLKGGLVTRLMYHHLYSLDYVMKFIANYNGSSMLYTYRVLETLQAHMSGQNS